MERSGNITASNPTPGNIAGETQSSQKGEKISLLTKVGVCALLAVAVVALVFAEVKYQSLSMGLAWVITNAAVASAAATILLMGTAYLIYRSIKQQPIHTTTQRSQVHERSTTETTSSATANMDSDVSDEVADAENVNNAATNPRSNTTTSLRGNANQAPLYNSRDVRSSGAPASQSH